MTLPREPLLILAVTAAASAAAGWGLRRFGGREARSWALPISVAMLYGGAGWALNLPDWLVVGGFLATPLVFHRGLRAGLESAARSCDRIALPEGEGALILRTGVREGAASGGIAAWDLSPGMDARLVLRLQGEEDGELRVFLEGTVPRGMSGLLCCQTNESSFPFEEVLSRREPLDGIPGLTGGMTVRALPESLGFALLDVPTLSVLGELLQLCTPARDIRLTISGPRLNLEATDVLSGKDLRKALECAGKVLERMRKIGAEDAAPGASGD